MSEPLVTIGIAAFNAENTIERAVHSALVQSWRPIEIVAVDDSSIDETWEVLVRMAAIHSELRVYRNQTNGGVAVSRNRILTEARGEFVAFFDDDDESLPDGLMLKSIGSWITSGISLVGPPSFATRPDA